MKKLLTLSAIWVSALVLMGERGVFRDSVTLTWDYPSNKLSGVVFFIYGSESLSVPMTNWQVVATATNQTWVTFHTAPANWFFAATASNWWGESVFSNVLEIPEPPSSDINLRLE